MADTTESMAELFYAKLKTTTNPGLVLAQFYGALFSAPVGRSEIIQLNRLVKMFGKSSVYLGLIDISRKDSFPEFPFGLLFKICKDRLENTLETEMTSSAFDSLGRRINEMQKEIPHIKKIDPEKASKFLDSRKDAE